MASTEAPRFPRPRPKETPSPYRSPLAREAEIEAPRLRVVVTRAEPPDLTPRPPAPKRVLPPPFAETSAGWWNYAGALIAGGFVLFMLLMAVVMGLTRR